MLENESVLHGLAYVIHSGKMLSNVLHSHLIIAQQIGTACSAASGGVKDNCFMLHKQFRLVVYQ